MNVSALKGRSLLTWVNYTEEEIRLFLDLAKKIKAESRKNRRHQRFVGKTLALFLEENSILTRSAIEVAFGTEGGHSVLLPGEFGLAGWHGTIEDLARALGRTYSGIVYKGSAHEVAEALAKHSGLPVYNARTGRFHPIQALTDLFTIEEKLGTIKGKRLVVFGDGRSALASSLLVIASKVGLDCTIATPSSLWPERELWDICQGFAAASGSSLSVTSDPVEAVRAADAVYADISGMPAEFRIDESLMEKTGSSTTVYLQTLGAQSQALVGREVVEGPQSLVFDQVENGKHVLKAILLATL